jgi:hypothetical protein
MALDATGVTAALKTLIGTYEVKVGAEFLNTGDIRRELGITLEDQQYAARLMALTKPGDYYTERKKLTDQMTTEVQLAFQKSFAEYANSGLPNDVSRQYAMQAARTTMAAKMQLIELRFPSGANAIGSASMSRAFAPEGLLPTRRAPAKKRRTRRR